MATILNDREIALVDTVPRIIATTTIIQSDNGAIFTTDNEGNITTGVIGLSAISTVFISPTYKWYYSNNSNNTWNEIPGVTGAYLGLDPASFLVHVDTGTKVTYKVVGSEPKYIESEGTFEIIYNNSAYIVVGEALSITKINPGATALATKKLPLNVTYGYVEWLQMVLENELIAIPYLKVGTIKYVLIRFNWLSTGGGVDLDTRVSFINSTTGYEDIQTGWCKEDSIGPPSHTLAGDNYYVFWGGDNTATNGKEEHVLNLTKFKEDFPAATEIFFALKAFWYSTIYTGNFSIEVEIWSGGVMQRNELDELAFINIGGTLVDEIVIGANTSVEDSECLPGVLIRTMHYDILNNIVTFLMPAATALHYIVEISAGTLETGYYLYNYSGGDTDVIEWQVDWGDGVIESGSGGIGSRQIFHTYASPGIYDVRINGSGIEQINTRLEAELPQIIECVSFGNIGLLYMDGMFSGCLNLISVPSVLPPGILNMRNMFAYCTSFNSPNLFGWDTSTVTDMNGMFYECPSFNQDISWWDVSSVTNMGNMFYNAISFNQDLSPWCVSLIPLLPSYFLIGASAWLLPKPVWGVCPAPAPIVFTVNTVLEWLVVNYVGGYPVGSIPYATKRIEVNYLASALSNVTIEWGDGTSTNYPVGTTIGTNVAGGGGASTHHIYESDGEYTITIYGLVDRFTGVVERTRLTSIVSWGRSSTITALTGAASGATSLASVPSYVSPYVTSIRNIFSGTTPNAALNNITSWDTSSITDMESSCANPTFNQNISDWNTGSVTNMRRMFDNAAAFNQDISGWNVSNVMNMYSVFEDAASFNQDLSSWDTSSVEFMGAMFYRATAFNGNITTWNTSSVSDMGSMFSYAAAFNQDISGWDVSRVTEARYMFYGATSFNKDLSGWCVSLIATEPYYFAQDASSWVLPKPVWGTCPP